MKYFNFQCCEFCFNLHFQPQEMGIHFHCFLKIFQLNFFYYSLPHRMNGLLQVVHTFVPKYPKLRLFSWTIYRIWPSCPYAFCKFVHILYSLISHKCEGARSCYVHKSFHFKNRRFTPVSLIWLFYLLYFG